MNKNSPILETKIALAEEDISLQSSDFQSGMGYLLRRGKWGAAKQLSSQMRKRVFSALNLFEDDYQKCLRKQRLREESCNDLSQTGKEMKALLEDNNFRKRLERSGLNNRFREAMSYLSSGCKKSEIQYSLFDIISSRSQYIVAIGYTGYWGDFHSTFNQYLDKFVPKPVSLSDIDKMKKMIQKEQSSISKNIRRLYSVTGKGNRDQMSQISLDILRLEELKIRHLATLCAEICATTRALLKGDLDGDVKKLGQVDLLAGKMARTWILLIVFSLYILFLTLLPKDNVTFENVTSTSRRLPFDTKNKKFDTVTPKELWTQSKKFDGKYLQLNGFVRNMTKTVSKSGFTRNIFEVYQPDSENFARVVVIFEDMDRMGLVNSAYAQLYGTWKHTSKIAKTPVLQLEKLRTYELKDHFGFNYILERVRPWFDYFPDSYHAFWSVRPQVKPQGSNKPLMGAGELVFVWPFSSLTGGR